MPSDSARFLSEPALPADEILLERILDAHERIAVRVVVQPDFGLEGSVVKMVLEVVFPLGLHPFIFGIDDDVRDGVLGELEDGGID
jgi:hypothetical protein